MIAAGISSAGGSTVNRQTKETNNLFAPAVQLARWLSVGIDDAGSRADTLQPDRFPHQHEFVVLTGWHDDHVAGLGGVDCVLDGLGCSEHGRLLSADCDRYGVDGLLAIGPGNQKLTTLRP